MGSFHFQRFSVRQASSGMKVCTDATLFGAMAPVAGGERVLDIGAGTGVLALMAMQLGADSADAVELSADACRDAGFNFAQSPWASRMRLIHGAIQEYPAQCDRRYDLIISNPPFFQQHSRNRDERRRLARHSDRLPHPELVDIAARLLAPDGTLYLLIPCHALTPLLVAAREKGLFPVQRCYFAPFHGRPAKVLALTLRRQAQPFVDRCLVIYNAPRDYSATSARYLTPFLLRFAEAASAKAAVASRRGSHPGHPTG